MKTRQTSTGVFFSDELLTKVGSKEIEFLRQEVHNTALKRNRLCVHRSLDDCVHEMFVLLMKESYIRPHKHIKKVESLYVVEGSADAIFFDDNGSITEIIQLGDYASGKQFYYRIGEPVYHTLLIRSEYFIYLETTQGPFKQSDSLKAKWSPKEENLASVKEYKRLLDASVFNILQRREFEKGSVLVVGSDGIIGGELARQLRYEGKTLIETTRRPKSVSGSRIFLDLEGDISEWRIPESISTAYICAAMSVQEKCKNSPVQSSMINVHNTVKLATMLVSKRIFVVVPSTNLVFDGNVGFRKSNEPMNPITEYGRQKAEADKQLLKLGDLVGIVRFSKVVGANMPLICNWINDLKRNRVIHPFSNMMMAPVALGQAVDVLYQVGKRRLSGVIQVSPEKDVTYAEVARYIASRIGVNLDLVKPRKWEESGIDLEAVPKHTALDTNRLRHALGIKPKGVWEVIDSLLEL